MVIRFDFGTDGSVTSIGWYVDDFSAVDIGTIVVGVESDGKEAVPDRFALDQNYPNPFNPITTMRYQLAEASTVSLRVYNALGQEVRTLLMDARKPAGVHTMTWDAKDHAGHAVSSGVYLYRLTTSSGYSKTMKMTLLK
jgi:hypothetical protein